MTVPGPYPDSLPSPVSSHSDSIGPPLSDLPSLSSDLSSHSHSHSHDDTHEDSESFDMVSSREWNRSVSRFEQSLSGSEAGLGESRMRLSFPDPLAEGREDETAYSFLLDARPEKAASMVEETVEERREEREEKQTYADVKSWIRTTSKSTSSSVEHLNGPPSPGARDIVINYVGGTADEREIVSSRFKSLSIDPTTMSQALMVQFVGRKDKEEHVERSIDDTVGSKVLRIISSRPPSLVTSISTLADSSTTIRDAVKPTEDIIHTRSPIRVDSTMTYDEFVAATDIDLIAFLKNTPAIEAVTMENAQDAGAEGDTTLVASESTSDDSPSSKASLLSRAILLLTAAIVIATASLLETSPTFASLRAPLSIPHSIPVMSPTTAPPFTSPTNVPHTQHEPHTSICANSACALALLESHPTSLSIFAPSSLKSPSLSIYKRFNAKRSCMPRHHRGARSGWRSYRSGKVDTWERRHRVVQVEKARVMPWHLSSGARSDALIARVVESIEVRERWRVASEQAGKMRGYLRTTTDTLDAYVPVVEQWIRRMQRTKDQIEGIVTTRWGQVVDQVRSDWRRDVERMKVDLAHGKERVVEAMGWASEAIVATKSVVEGQGRVLWVMVRGDELKDRADRKIRRAVKGWGRIKRSEVCWSWEGGFAVRR